MYHCHIHFYLTGHPCRTFEMIKEMYPLEHFTHEFLESEKPDGTLMAKADVILANLQDMDAKEAVQALVLGRRKESELIVLADKNQIALLMDGSYDSMVTEIKDIWPLTMMDGEIRFRFLRWQQSWKMSKDFWQTSHYLEATINSTPNLIWYKDKEGIHKKVNDSFCKTVNKSKEQVEGQRHAYIWDVEQDDPACIESEQEVMNTRKTFVSEEIIQTGDGKRTLTTYKSPLYDLDGSVMGTIGIAIDITQERAYEKEIKNKNYTLEKIFTTMDCGVIYHTADRRQILSINRAALKILGYESQDELMEKGFEMFPSSVVDEDKERLQKRIGLLKKEGDSISEEYRIQHTDGKMLHIMVNIKLLKEHGELCYQQFLLDCTAQKMKEKKNERRQLELIHALSIDYNLVCYFEMNTGKGIQLRNDDEVQHISHVVFSEEMSLADSMEPYIQKYVHEDDREMMQQALSLERLKKELAEKKLYYVKYRIFVDGEIKYFEMKIVRAGTWEENHGIVLGLHSVDEETRNEMEKKSLLEDALLQANKANKAKSIFLSNMSHDIRTPMNAIVGFTTLALSHIDRQEQVEEYLKKIMTSGNHLLSLINDILDMSRIESGKMQLDEKPCSLPEIVHGLCNILHADIHAKQLDLRMYIVDVVDEEIYCDKLRLNQVLLNLLSNSVKYTNEGGSVSMRITQKPGAPAGYASYEFYIQDTGIGMNEEFVLHIFEPFERERNSTISKIQGTGLGMAITKNIVDMMNGSIAVKSEQGVGTEFTLSFTFRLPSGAGKPQDIPEMKNGRALVVDNDFNSCDSISYMLQQIGLRSEWTLSGKEAVLRTHQAVMRNDNYSVYIIDWGLPDVNSIEIIQKIKSEMGESAPIIIMTAYDWSDIEEEVKEAGATALCSKPLFLSELRNCLQSTVSDNEVSEKRVGKEPLKIHTGRILLAEDVEMNQEIATAILGDAGFSIEVAENGQIAVDMLEKSEPGYYQLVLMDVQMPVMNGYEAAQAIRNLENKKLASIPIIAMTANAFEEDRQESLRCGMNGHIAKPIDIDILFDTLTEILA